MSIINKMLKDLEKRGVKPAMSFGNTNKNSDQSTAPAAETTTNTAATTAENATENKAKQPSRLIIYSVIFLIIYLAFYAWISLQSDNTIKQTANPLQAQQYQPKAVIPLHQTTMNTQQVHAANAGKVDVVDEIKAAIAAEVNQANGSSDAALNQLLAEAESARQKAIEQALKIDTQLAIKSQTAANKPKKVHQAPVVDKPKKIATSNKRQHKTRVAQVKAPKKPQQRPHKVVKATVVKTNKAKTHAPTPSHKLANAQPQPTKAKLAKAAPLAKQQEQATPNVSPAQMQPKIVKTMHTQREAEALYQNALDYVQEGRVSEAQTMLANALEIDPAHQDARQTLAALLLDNQRIQAAKDVLQEGLVVTPNHLAFRMAVARLEVELGAPNKALDTLLFSKKIALNHADYQAFLGSLLQGQNRHTEAITHFQNALNINRGLSNVLIGMGISYQALEQLDEAKMAYQKAQHNQHLPSNLKTFLSYRLKEVEQRLSSK